MRHRALLPALATALLAPFAVLTPAAANASPTVTSVTMVSDANDPIGGGRPRLFTPDNGTVELSGGPDAVQVRVTGGTAGDAFDLRFAAPQGEALGLRTYETDPAGGPSLSISGEGRACDGAGAFRVLDLGVTEGQVSRLHLLYEHRCGPEEPALFGEVRVGMPNPFVDLVVTPDTVTWPRTPQGHGATTVPVTVTNTGGQPLAFSAPEIIEDASSSFSVVGSTCPSPLPAGASCAVEVGFTPRTAGELSAGLVLPLGDGGSPLVWLAGIGEAASAQPAPAPQPTPAPRFSDIAGDPHEPNIVVVAEDGIAGGYPDGTYRPRLSVTRGQMATFLTRALELPASPSAGFTDTAGHPHAAAIDAVAEWGIAGGYPDGSYRPDATVTRGQMATFLARALDLPFAPSAGFTDTVGDPHERAIDAVAEWGITGGYPDGSYRPGNGVTRGQLATFLVRALYEPAEPSAA